MMLLLMLQIWWQLLPWDSYHITTIAFDIMDVVVAVVTAGTVATVALATQGVGSAVVNFPLLSLELNS